LLLRSPIEEPAIENLCSVSLSRSTAPRCACRPVSSLRRLPPRRAFLGCLGPVVEIEPGARGRVLGLHPAWAASPRSVAYRLRSVIRAPRRVVSSGSDRGEDFGNTGWNDDALLSHYFPLPDLWDPSFNLGVPVDFNLANVPLFWIADSREIGLGWTVSERLLWLFPLFVLLPLSPYVLAMRLTKSPWASSAAGLVFSLNTWTVGLIERGHIPSLVAYALIPLVSWPA